MNILFVIKSTANLRTLAPVLRLLDSRGHTIRIASKEVKTSETHAFAQQLVAECPGLSFVTMPYIANGGWSEVAWAIRTTLDYLRYLDPRYRTATKLRARAEREVPTALRRPARTAALAGPAGVAGARTALRAVERCLAPSPRATRFLSEQAPDVLLIAPLVGFGSSQADLLRAAKRLGIRSGYPVPSWDNLTNKGLLRDAPDLVIVWNELQALEAVELHGVPAANVRITGAPAYDHWFQWQPSRTRADLCRETGLDPARPIILYACSTQFIAPEEPAFVASWLAALRRHDALRDVGVLVRPHPLGAPAWSDFDLGDPQATVWPRLGQFPLGERERQDYFDSIFHSAAVVGINTSALVESAIVRRPVHTVLADEFRATQEGTLHFRYLVDQDFGHLRVAHSLEEHAEQLARSLEEGDREGLNERFLRRFVRPLGLDEAAAPLAASAIEELAARPAPLPEQDPALAPLVRLALSPLARRAGRARRRRKTSGPPGTPVVEAKRQVRELARGRTGPVVAGPWTGDGIGELLYWIPFLRWAVIATTELADRLVVVAPSASASWYAGLADRIIRLDDLEVRNLPRELGPILGTSDFALLEPSLLAPCRPALARQDPWGPLHERLLEFAPLAVSEDAQPLGLPPRYVATHFAFGAAFPDTPPNRALAEAAIEACAGRVPVARLDAFDTGETLGVVARADAFLGTYGPMAYLAAFAGVPAVGLYAEPDGVDDDDLLLASSVLSRPGFEPMRAVRAEGDSDQAIESVVGLLRDPERAPTVI